MKGKLSVSLVSLLLVISSLAVIAPISFAANNPQTHIFVNWHWTDCKGIIRYASMTVTLKTPAQTTRVAWSFPSESYVAVSYGICQLGYLPAGFIAWVGLMLVPAIGYTAYLGPQGGDYYPQPGMNEPLLVNGICCATIKVAMWVYVSVALDYLSPAGQWVSPTGYGQALTN